MPDPGRAGPATLEMDQYIAASPHRVWQAITDPERLARWWVPGDIAAVVGHAFHLDLPGWGQVPCRVLEVVEPTLLVHTFDHWILTWRVVPEGHGTRLLLAHDGPDTDETRDRAALLRAASDRRGTLPAKAAVADGHASTASGWELAQVNIALPTAPLSQPELAWFVEALAPVNAAADAADGFRGPARDRRTRRRLATGSSLLRPGRAGPGWSSC